MRKILSVLLLTLLIATLAGPIPAHAAGGVLHVKLIASGDATCSTWANACTLQTALAMAEATDEIWVQAGVYKPGTERTNSFALENGFALYGGFAGHEISRDARDWVANETILSGDIDSDGTLAGNSYNVVTASGTDQTAILDGFTITGGNANHGSTPQYRNGGGIYNTNGSPTLRNLIIRDNSASQNGGALFNYNNSNPTLTDVRFENNQSDSSGGAIFNFGNSNPVINRAYFIGNTANAYFGGGIYYENSDGASITNAIFYNNSAQDGGGGIYAIDSPNIQITNVTFYANRTRADTNVDGGAIANQDSDITVKNSILWGNLAKTDGTPINSEIKIISQDLVATVNVSHSIVQGSWPGTGNLNSDPRFVSASTGDLKLQNTSPAINSGTNDGCPIDDIEGTGRPYGPSCDMGAYEMAVEPLTSTDVTVTIGEDWMGTYSMGFPSNKVEQYPVAGGPVVISSDNGANIIASMLQLRRQDVSGGWTGITQLMGVQQELIGTTYVFPRYHGTDPTKYQTIQIANYDDFDALVTITIGSIPYGPFTVIPGENFVFRDTAINAGPVIVSSNGARIIASLYELKRQASSGKWTGQTQMMGIPFSQLSDIYVFPRYNNTLNDLDANLIYAVP